jgi:hypothetical protein
MYTNDPGYGRNIQHWPHTPTMTDKELLTAREMASRFRIALRTVWSLTARGALPAPLRWGRRCPLARGRRRKIHRPARKPLNFSGLTWNLTLCPVSQGGIRRPLPRRKSLFPAVFTLPCSLQAVKLLALARLRQSTGEDTPPSPAVTELQFCRIRTSCGLSLSSP